MAKLKVGMLTVLNLFEIFWDTNRNVRRRETYGDADKRKGLIASLSHGWDRGKTQNVLVEIMTDEEVAEAVSKLNTQYEQLKQAEREAEDPKDARLALKAFEYAYVKDGKILAPKVFGTTAFRRSICILPAIALAIKEGQKRDFEMPTFEIGVEVVHFETEAERIIEQVKENENKAEGAMDMDVHSLLVAGYAMFNAGERESTFRKSMKTGTAQKIFGLLSVNRAYEDVHLYDRVIAGLGKESITEYVPGGPVPYGPLNKEVLRMFVSDEPAKLHAWNGDYGLEPTEAGVERYIELCIKKNKPVQPAMKNTDVVALSKQNGTTLVRRVLEAVVKNDRKLISNLQTGEALFNLAYIIHNNGLQKQGEDALRAILDAEGISTVAKPAQSELEAEQAEEEIEGEEAATVGGSEEEETE